MDIKEARFHAGLSQYDVSLKTGIPQSKLSLIENGYAKPLPCDKKKLAEALRVKECDLFQNNFTKKGESI